MKKIKELIDKYPKASVVVIIAVALAIATQIYKLF